MEEDISLTNLHSIVERMQEGMKFAITSVLKG
jgi:hypothetical protein